MNLKDALQQVEEQCQRNKRRDDWINKHYLTATDLLIHNAESGSFFGDMRVLKKLLGKHANDSAADAAIDDAQQGGEASR